jgi:hypothetical protein
MCQSKAEGGYRCAGHTYPAYRQFLDRALNADPATCEALMAQSDEAVLAFASTKTGNERVAQHADYIARTHPDSSLPAYLNSMARRGGARLEARAESSAAIRAEEDMINDLRREADDAFLGGSGSGSGRPRTPSNSWEPEFPEVKDREDPYSLSRSPDDAAFARGQRDALNKRQRSRWIANLPSVTDPDTLMQMLRDGRGDEPVKYAMELQETRSRGESSLSISAMTTELHFSAERAGLDTDNWGWYDRPGVAVYAYGPAKKVAQWWLDADKSAKAAGMAPVKGTQVAFNRDPISIV